MKEKQNQLLLKRKKAVEFIYNTEPKKNKRITQQLLSLMKTLQTSFCLSSPLSIQILCLASVSSLDLNPTHVSANLVSMLIWNLLLVISILRRLMPYTSCIRIHQWGFQTIAQRRKLKLYFNRDLLFFGFDGFEL